MIPFDALQLGLGNHLVSTGGRWERTGESARFTPHFASAPGADFIILGRPDPSERWRRLAQVTTPGDRPASTAFVASIDPAVEEIPENLLRFSVTFSAPMEEGSAAGRISLRGAGDREIAWALFGMPPELWDRERRRLTVLLEPGRIKRGLQPNVQAGPPLREGDTVRLVIGSQVRDAAGARLVEPAERTYRVGPPLRARVDPHLWQVVWPGAGEDRLVVGFDRPLDRALVNTCLSVVDADGRPVPGRATIDDGASSWTFTPTARGDGVDRDWRLRVETRLEDLAGNSVRRVFDRDLDVAGEADLDVSHVIIGGSRTE